MSAHSPKMDRPTSKLNNIQLLRAYASVAVVYFHTGFQFGPVHPIGSFGVDLFFIISGYIMARILDNEKTRQYFLRRRILRIVPPYWFFTLLIFFASMLVPQMMVTTRGNTVQLLKSLFFIPFMKIPGLMRPTLFVGWSINYEMYFYAALALGLAISARRAVWIGSGIILAIFALCSLVAHPGTFALFYGNPIVIEFVMGVVGYFACKSIGPIRSLSAKFAILALGLLSALLLAVIQGFHLYFTHIAPLSFGLLAWFAVCSAVLLASSGWDTRNRLFILVGDSSYILYLVHPFVIYFIDRALTRKFGEWLSQYALSGMLIDVAASVALGILLHVYAERPILRLLTTRFGGHRPPSEFAPAAKA